MGNFFEYVEETARDITLLAAKLGIPRLLIKSKTWDITSPHLFDHADFAHHLTTS